MVSVLAQDREMDTNIKDIKSVVFFPATPGRKVRKQLQEADEVICKAINSPTLRFVE